jgi:hypothetical protein
MIGNRRPFEILYKTSILDNYSPSNSEAYVECGFPAGDNPCRYLKLPNGIDVHLWLTTDCERCFIKLSYIPSHPHVNVLLLVNKTNLKLFMQGSISISEMIRRNDDIEVHRNYSYEPSSIEAVIEAVTKNA